MISPPVPIADALVALETSAVVCPVSPAGLLCFSGEDSQTFLHGQLSSDVQALDENNVQYSSYSSPKGRVLASFLVFRQHGDYWLQLADDLAPAMQKRLSMYILRSKTRCRDASTERVLIGVAGPQAASLIEKVTGVVPPTSGIVHAVDYSVIGLSGQRFQVIASPDHAVQLTQGLLADTGATLASADVWRLTDIRAGIPWISSVTQEEFVLQMVNLDLIGGVSFTKGCYPGQEIVARTRYLGKVKRRMYRATIDTELVTLGQNVLSPEMNGQPSGKILSAVQVREGRWECLFVAQMSSAEYGFYLDTPSKPNLAILPLPYDAE